MKKTVSALLALLLCFLLTVPAFAADVVASGECGKDGDNVTWTLESGGTLTISGTGEMKDYYHSPWYSRREDIRRVEIQSGVTSIGVAAFRECSSLTSVSIPEGVTSIGAWAFENCSSLTRVIIPEGVTAIGYGAFIRCSSLTSVSISESVTSIGGSAFAYCSSLTIVNIPKGVTSIDYAAFYNCSNLTDVYYGGTEAQWGAIEIDSRYNDPLTSATIHYNSSGDTKSLASAVVTVLKAAYPYSGKAIRPAVTVKLNGKRLTKNADYTVAYSNNKEVGTATVTVTGKGDYTGTAFTTFEIVSTTKPLDSAVVTVPKASYDYTGKALKPVVTVKLDGKRLRKNTDYTVEYSNNKDVGTATVTITGKGDYTGTATTTFEIVSKTKPLDGATVTGLRKSYAYSGKAIKPTVTVKLDGTRLRKNTDYTVKYTNNTKIGTATVTITGKGGYTGTIQATFLIVK